MNNISLINRVKYNKHIYTLYFYIGSYGIRFLKLFVNSDPRMIVFTSFGGRKYDDSPKAIYEAMIHDSRYDGYNLVWAFMHPEDFNIPRGGKVKIDTVAYYKILLRARIWVTNSSMTRGLKFSGKNTFQLNTWHGSAIKRIGSDINSGSTSFRIKGRSKINGVMLAQSDYDVKVYSRAFNMSTEDFKVIGLPRNDELVNTTKKKQDELKMALGIPKSKKVILYAPTFREYVKDENFNCVIAPPIDLKKWKSILGKSYIFLFRAHYEVVKVMNIQEDDFVRNVSSYPELNELMIISDILISDYSSIFFDYSVMHKPMICFAYDYDEYAQKRGVYFDIRKWLPYASNENDLLKLICDTDDTKINEVVKRFQQEFVSEYGRATERSLDLIYEGING